MPVSRKECLAANAAAGTWLATPQAQTPTLAFQPDDPNIVYELTIKNGTVVDPSQTLHAPRDVAVIAKATVVPAQIIDRVAGLGTLSIGAPADIAIFRLVEGPITFLDTMGNTRIGRQKLEPVTVIKGGRPHGLPFPNPFTYT